MWPIGLIIANAGVLVTEYLYRTDYFNGFWVAIHYYAPLAIIVQYGLYLLWKGGKSMFWAGAVFSFTALALRIVNVEFFIKEDVGLLSYLGVAAAVLAVVLTTLDKV